MRYLGILLIDIDPSSSAVNEVKSSDPNNSVGSCSAAVTGSDISPKTSQPNSSKDKPVQPIQKEKFSEVADGSLSYLLSFSNYLHEDLTSERESTQKELDILLLREQELEGELKDSFAGLDEESKSNVEKIKQLKLKIVDLESREKDYLGGILRQKTDHAFTLPKKYEFCCDPEFGFETSSVMKKLG